MERMTISLDDELVDQFEQFLVARGYRNRSEAIRDLIRERLEAERMKAPEGGHCIGTLCYVYNHHERMLASRLTEAQHRHHDLAVSTLHVHLDHDNCLETVVLRGPTRTVEEFANSVISQAGVRHGRLYLVPVEIRQATHAHDDTGSGHTHPHTHAQPIT